MKKLTTAAMALAAFLATTGANADILIGTVTSVIDGDEFMLTVEDGEEYHLKIAEVLSPEAYWSTPAFASLIKGEDVRAATVKPLGMSKDGPTNAHVYTKSTNVAYEMLRLGLVKVDRAGYTDQMKLSIENEAREVGRGMWKHENE